MHVLEAPAIVNWQEVPIGGIHRGPDAFKKMWYNHAIVPLFATIALASMVCGGFLIKYFGGHTEISFSKSIRATFDHQGLSESRVASHNSHFGARSLNKKDFSIFPFSWLSMSSVSKKHNIPYE